jgi:transcription elongation GreA/GreB family factor
MSKLNKKEVIEKIVAKLQEQVDSQLEAARAAHEAATHEESKAEDQHDTRGLEASYLAGAQAQRAADLQILITVYRQLPSEDLAAGALVAPGALVELELVVRPGHRTCYFIAPHGGGVSVVVDGVTIQVISPQSPLGEAVTGRKAGDIAEVEAKDSVREYRVVSVS